MLTRLAALVSERLVTAWIVGLVVIVLSASAVGMATLRIVEADHAARLQTEAARRAVEVMSQTLNGNIMGSLSLLGAVDPDIKQDARGDVASANSPKVLTLLEHLSRVQEAQGSFVVGAGGMVFSSWDSSGRPSTGLDVRFRPYFKTAMQGRDNVYAAVSLSRGDRSMYFASAIHADTDRNSPAIGVLVARTDLAQVDRLLSDRSDLSLLLSPQGVVFASNRSEWIGRMAVKPDASQLGEIREMKQFGAMFQNADPLLLPFRLEEGIITLEGRRYALADAHVQWNDPLGAWRIVLMEDLSRGATVKVALAMAGAAALVFLVIGVLGLYLLRSHHRQNMDSRAIAAFAKDQEASLRRKSLRAEAAMKMQRAKSMEELGRVFLSEAHRTLGALQGMIYAFERADETAMRLVASYASENRIPDRLEAGEGLLGQSVLDRQARFMDTTAHHSWIIRSGLGNTRPEAVMLAPLILDEQVLGAVELAVIAAPDRNARDLFLELATLLALNLEILRRQHGQAMPMTEARS